MKKVLSICLVLLFGSIPVMAQSSLQIEGQWNCAVDCGDIYSPDLSFSTPSQGVMIFGGWYFASDYPLDTIYQWDNNGVQRVLQIPKVQVNDPTFGEGYMFYTYAASGTGLNNIYRSTFAYGNPSRVGSAIPTLTYVNGIYPEAPSYVNQYLYYDGSNNVIYRARLDTNGNAIKVDVVNTGSTQALANVNVVLYNNVYYMLADESYNDGLALGMWSSTDGLNFNPMHNPLITPDAGNTQARSAWFKFVDSHTIDVWYGQSTNTVLDNAIYYQRVII